MTGWLKSKIKSSEIICPPESDHKGIISILNLSNTYRGPGYWKLNVSVLDEKEYQEEIKSIFKETINKFSSLNINKNVIWDIFKIKIKEYTTKYCSYLKTNKNCCIKEIQDNIRRLNNQLAINNNYILETKRAKLKTELDLKVKESYRGAQIRSRAKYIDLGEQPTNYFLNLEKNRQRNNTINKLKKTSNENIVLTEQSDILNECTDFTNNYITVHILKQKR